MGGGSEDFREGMKESKFHRVEGEEEEEEEREDLEREVVVTE